MPLHDVFPYGELWAEMEALVDEGLVRSIGISNHTTHQIDALLSSPKVTLTLTLTITLALALTLTLTLTLTLGCATGPV